MLMCTAMNMTGVHHVFGRTLDIERAYGEQVAITPVGRSLRFLYEGVMESHAALLGVAHVCDGVALYYDAINDAGLGMAALRFPRSAVYHKPKKGACNLASFEVIPYVLGRARTLRDAEEILRRVNVTDAAFSADLPPTPLHWIVADRKEALVLESVAEGVRVYRNPLGVLTNEPPFPHHLSNVAHAAALSPFPAENHLAPRAFFESPENGTGALGLPGDFSSPSRFLRAVFATANATCGASEREEVGRFFQAASTVNVPEGLVRNAAGECVKTMYTACGCTDTLTYYTATYERRATRAISMRGVPRGERELLLFEL